MNKFITIPIISMLLVITIILGVMLSSTKNELSTAKQTLINTQSELSTTKQTLANTQSDLSTTKNTLANTQTELSTTKQTLAIMKSELSLPNQSLTISQLSAIRQSIHMSWSAPPSMQIDISKQYFAVVNTSLGNFTIHLFPQESPMTVNNFVFLSQQKYYDLLVFHRIIKTFIIQTGDPTGTGGGGPGYKFADELPVKHSYDPGIVAMANAGPNTNGSQFFICTGDKSSNLNNYPNYTQFGQVTEGMDVVLKIASVSVEVNPSNPGETSKPVNPPMIYSITITEN